MMGKIIQGVAALTLVTAAAVQADDSGPQDGVTLGVGAQYAPRYSGSDTLRLQPVPVLQARQGAFFADAQKGIGYDLQSANGIYLEHTLGYGLGRADRNSDWRDGADRLSGMGNIAATVNTGLALGWQMTPWFSIEGKAVLPLSDSQGVNYQASFTLVPLQSQSDTVALQTAALFGDGRYMNTWYGVSEQQSQRSRFNRYDAAAGFYGTNTSLLWNHQFDAHWGTLVSAGYTWLGDHAANSPLVARRNEGTGLLAITYTF
ncbi:MipA/OmpV family protein [Pantoea sp. Mb-10]|uniref:MipA/OmpV family protein n=1 Tax=unclassified Pantoea TaxID=2630326 RepID=UPI001E3A02E2|nr:MULTISPECIES: MipA/OmpV family protein [unclassified Pantoea]MCE0491927.1 MipA/OmpV family protein [Pantoea sp. Mb-10]MCE0503336.1 MipA/OmpV family protein [Pantoea sp. Pb-8]